MGDERKREPLARLQDVADYLSLSVSKVYGLAQKGEIPAFKVGKSWRFRLAEIEAWLNSRRRGRNR